MNRFAVSDLPLAGLKLIERQRLSDDRGFLSRLFCTEELATVGWVKPIVQINHTYTTRCGTVRGMHFQRPPKTEMKLVSCIRGMVWDVAVDVRTDSQTFLRWHAVPLSAENQCALLIPEGFAHGYQALTADAELLYFHTAAYSSSAETGLNPMDAQLAIKWPLPVSALSARDKAHPLIDTGFEGMHC